MIWKFVKDGRNLYSQIRHEKYIPKAGTMSITDDLSVYLLMYLFFHIIKKVAIKNTG